MQKKELQELAKKVQLEIKEEEVATYLATFQHLEKLLVNFQKIKIGKGVKVMDRIEVGHLTLSDLAKLKKKFASPRVGKKILKNNSEISEEGFILFKNKK